MTPDYFQQLYDYHYWANDKIRRETEKVSDADFAKPLSKGYGSLRGTLVHLIAAEWLWRLRVHGESPNAMMREEDFPTLAAINARWAEEQAALRAYVAKLTDAELQRMVHYVNTRGDALARPVWQILAQVANHGTQHRAEAAAMLTDFGFSPGNLDLTIYFDESGKKEQ